MSLLNDALKQAEQRQQRPAPAAYTGQGGAATGGNGGRSRLLSGIALLVILGIAGYTGWQFVMGPDIPAPGETRQASLAQDAQPAPVADTREQTVADVARLTGQPETQAGAVLPPAPEPAGQPLAVAEKSSTVAAEESAKPAEPTSQPTATVVQSENKAPAPSSSEREVTKPDPEPPQPAQGAEPSKGVAGTGPREPASRQTSAEPMNPAPKPENIKQARQTPAQRDLATAKAIRELLSDGNLAAAETMLNDITAGQTAPHSRYAFARGVLARGDVDRALAWAPADLALRHPDLRLIRARALLAGGGLGQAVATLQTAVPPVADQVEYRVTLATLLQQQGNSEQAARHWAELIAWDNGRAPWWVGLAIALEGRGDVPAARRAYQQAAALPGLAPSLADYVRQRLQILGAG